MKKKVSGFMKKLTTLQIATLLKYDGFSLANGSKYIFFQYK